MAPDPNSPSELTPLEAKILNLYRQPASATRRKVIRLIVQYAVGSGIFLALAIMQHQPLYAIGTYATFLAFLAIRLRNMIAIGEAMPRVIAQFDQRIAELEQRLAALQPKPDARATP